MDSKRILKQAAAEHTLVLVERDGVSDDWLTGYVAACGPEWFALDIVDQSIRYDGHSCLRYADVTVCEAPAPGAEFTAKALAALGVQRPPLLGLDLSSLESLLRTAGSLYPVLTLHLEIAEPDACWVGRVQELNRHLVTLQLVNPDGQWEPEPEEFALEELTRVDFGTDYERALVLVAGPGGLRFN